MTVRLRTRGPGRAALGGLLALLVAGCAAAPGGPDAAGGRSAAATAAASKRTGADRFGTMMRLGDAARRSGDWSAAASLYRQATDVDPNDPRGHIALGEALIAVGNPGTAAQAFGEALRLAPENRDAARGYARALIALDRPEEAAARYAALVEADPADVHAINGLGVAYDLAGRHADAQATYRRGLVHEPDNLALRNNLGLSLALSDEPEAAIPILRRVASSPGATPRNRQNLALAYGLAGDTANAERVGRLDLNENAVRDNLAFYAEVRARNGTPAPGARGNSSESAGPGAVAGGNGRAAGPNASARTGGGTDLTSAPPQDSVAKPIVIKLDARLPARAAAAEPAAKAADGAPPEERAAAAAGAGGTPAGADSDATGPGLDAIAVEGQGLQLGFAASSRQWFLELGEHADGRRATNAWHDLRRRYPGMLAGLNRLASIERGRQPLLVGPVASGAEARELCGRLKGSGEACRAVLL